MARETVVVTKSTVPVGTALKVQAVVERWASYPFHMCTNPEFLKEGAAVEDFLRPDRVVLGVDDRIMRAVSWPSCTRRSCAPVDRSSS